MRELGEDGLSSVFQRLEVFFHARGFRRHRFHGDARGAFASLRVFELSRGVRGGLRDRVLRGSRGVFRGRGEVLALA